MASRPLQTSETIATDFQRVFRHGPGMLLLFTPGPPFTIIDVSDAYLRGTRFTPEDLIGRTLLDALSRDQHPTHAITIENLRLSLERVVTTRARDVMPIQQYDLRRPDGEAGFEERYWSATNSPIIDEQDELLYIIHRVEDATELVRMTRREQLERAELAEAHSRFQAIYDQGLFAGRLDLHGTVSDVNRSSLEQCGFRREDVIGKPFWECGWWNRSVQVQDYVKRAVQEAIGGAPFRGESTYFLADGTRRVVDFACIPIKDGNGNVLFVVPTGMDITERVAGERDQRATQILESITEGFFGFDRTWRFTYVNRAAEEIVGQSASELLGNVLWDVYPGLIGSPFERGYRRSMTERETFTMTEFYPDHDRWYEVHTYPAADGISVYFRNVTEQKRVEQERERLAAVAETQRRIYEAALSNTPDLVYVFDLDHRFTYANEALLTMWGRTREDALGKNCLELGYEPWQAEMHDREIERVISTRMPIRGEVPFTGTQGRRIYDYIFVPVVGPGGDVVAVAGTARDVTERQRAENAIREQAERLRALDRAKDEFLATLSHELRNPLAPLRNSLSVLRMTTRDDSAAAPVHEMMERQVNHLVRLVDDLLETSRLTRGALMLRKEPVEVTTIVRNALETTQPAIEAAYHRLSVTLPEEALWVNGDPVRLAQIVGNLLDNAAKYTDDGGDITVTVQRAGEHVAIAVRDTGAGIPPDALPRMFEMFSRGEPRGHHHDGLGIGLALARRLAEMHGGTLEAHSAGAGAGSEFTLRLPLTAGDADRPAEPPVVAAAFPRKRILVVDDNRDAADSLGMMLELLGAEVRVTRNGDEALEVFSRYAPAVVLLDIGMPGMDGYEVARLLRHRFPEHDATIVALTGWGQDSDRQRAREAGFDHHLIKPAEMTTLQALLGSLHQ